MMKTRCIIWQYPLVNVLMSRGWQGTILSGEAMTVHSFEMSLKLLQATVQQPLQEYTLTEKLTNLMIQWTIATQ